MNTHSNHIVICGYTAGARMFLDTLRRERDWGDREVLIFAEGERPKDVPPEFSWVNGDPTKESESNEAYTTSIVWRMQSHEMDSCRYTLESPVVMHSWRSRCDNAHDRSTSPTTMCVRQTPTPRPRPSRCNGSTRSKM